MVIHTLRISKPGSREDASKLRCIRRFARPKNITYSEGWLSYDYIDGVPCNDPLLVLDLLRESCWDGECKRELSRDLYMMHIEQLMVHFKIKPIDFRLDIITPVRFCHGDATMMNCIKGYRGGLTLIDPGRTWGLPCEELDIAKLRLSYAGLDEKMRGLPPPVITNLPHSRTIIELEITHAIRLLQHVKPNVCIWAMQRIKDLRRTL